MFKYFPGWKTIRNVMGTIKHVSGNVSGNQGNVQEVCRKRLGTVRETVSSNSLFSNSVESDGNQVTEIQVIFQSAGSSDSRPSLLRTSWQISQMEASMCLG